MVSVRPAHVSDLLGMQACNLFCLPENYQLKYYLLHELSWSPLLYIAEEPFSKKIVGYVLAKIDEDAEGIHGHITSLSVLRSYRKLGLATKLMRCTLDAMKEVYDAEFVSLHVRVSNRAAFTLYKTVLGFEIHDVEKGYYADKEDAYDMRLTFKEKSDKDAERIGGRIGGRINAKKVKKQHDSGGAELDNLGENTFSEGPKKKSCVDEDGDKDDCENDNGAGDKEDPTGDKENCEESGGAGRSGGPGAVDTMAEDNLKKSEGEKKKNKKKKK